MLEWLRKSTKPKWFVSLPDDDWQHAAGWTGEAWTESEALALVKGSLGTLPPGTVVEKVGQVDRRSCWKRVSSPLRFRLRRLLRTGRWE